MRSGEGAAGWVIKSDLDGKRTIRLRVTADRLGRPPVVGPLLVIEVPDAGDKRGMALTFRPIDRFSLRFEGGEHVVRMVFHDIIVGRTSLSAALGARFNVNVRHALLSLGTMLLCAK
jgi:hypothetical protein